MTPNARFIMAARPSRIERFRHRQQELHDSVNARWPGAIADPFDLLAPLSMSRRDVEAFFAAAAAIARIYSKVARLLPRLPEPLLQDWGYAASLRRSCLRDVSGSALFLSRIDLV